MKKNSVKLNKNTRKSVKNKNVRKRKSVRKNIRKRKSVRKNGGGDARETAEEVEEIIKLLEAVSRRDISEDEKIDNLKDFYRYVIDHPNMLMNNARFRNRTAIQVDEYLQSPSVKDDNEFKNLSNQLKLLIADFSV
jgi:hypothetical protein